MDQSQQDILKALKKRVSYQNSLKDILHYYNYYFRAYKWSEKSYMLTSYAVQHGIVEPRKPIDCHKLKLICAKKSDCTLWLCESALRQLLEEYPEFDSKEQYKAIAWVSVNNDRKGKSALNLGNTVDLTLLQEYIEEVKAILDLENAWAVHFQVFSPQDDMSSEVFKFSNQAWKDMSRQSGLSIKQLKRLGYMEKEILLQVNHDTVCF